MTEETVMAMPTKEQLKVFWEWCGLFRGSTKDVCTLEPYNAWFVKGSSPTSAIEVSRDLPILDLNNLFKYAAPKLESVQLAKFADTRWHAIIQKGSLEDAVADDPTLALFWAIWKVISAEVKND